MMQDAGVVVEHLDEDIPPQPAQSLAIGEHGDGTGGRLASTLKRLRLRVLMERDASASFE
jgi:hypothetical protein